MVNITYQKRKFEPGGFLDNPIIEDEGIPPDLAPIGSSPFYYQPDPVDPRNCRDYPDSPFCGGIPISPTIFEASLEPTIDSCGRVFLELNATIGFVDMPPQTFAYVPEGCRGEPPQDKNPRSTGSPVERLGEGDYGHLRGNKNYIVALDNSRNTTITLRCGGVNVGVARVSQYQGSQGNETIDPYPRPTFYVSGIPVSEIYNCNIYDKVPASGDASDAVRLGMLKTSSPSQMPFLISGNGALIKKYLSGNCGIYTEEETDWFPGRFVNRPPTYEKGKVWIAQSKELETCLPANRTEPPPPFPPNKPCDCMDCCGNPASDAKLDKLLKEIEALKKAVGVEKFPYNVPNDITDDDAGERSIPDLATANSHHVKLLDQISGKYPIEIEVEDTDLVEEGEQTLKITLPNQAEMLAEIFGLVYQIKTTNEAGMSASLRALAETGAVRNTATQQWFLSLAIAEFLGFELKKKQTNMKYAFDPLGTSLDSVLKEGESKLSTFEWAGGNDLQDRLAAYDFASKIIKGALFVPTGSTEGTKQKIAEILKQDATDSGANEEEFDDFIRSVENGFGTVTGIDEKLLNKPYGRDREFRPNIKELGKDGDTTSD